MRHQILGVLIVMLLGGMAVWAAPDRQANLFELFLIEARDDLELLADEAYGEGVRPESWTFNFEVTSESFVGDLWYDHAVTAEKVFGPPGLPDNWFGATTANEELLARNVRHDLELTADEVFGSADLRPPEWNGAEPIYRCERTIQNLNRLLNTIYEERAETSLSVSNYCEALVFDLQSEVLNPILTDIPPFEGNQSQEIVLAARGDLERLANEVLGVNNRPGAWIGNIESASPNLAADLNSDLERLADIVLEGLSRPDGWSRFIPEAPAVSAINLRYNLEVLTDTSLGPSVRPNGWQGVDPLLRCQPVTQTQVYILGALFGFQVDAEQASGESFCAAADFTANNFAENPPQIDLDEVIEDAAGAAFQAESLNAFSFLDVGTTQYMGIMPRGTRFRAWYRNYQESTMMYVTGLDEDFGLFIDRRWTTLDPDIFARLPNLDGVAPLTFCEANWCNGPGPTPTPTGGALLRLHGDNQTAIPDQQSVEEVQEETGKTQVSWNHIRVTYLLDRPELNSVQVALEICIETTQVNCEPVTRVLDQTLGAERPVLSQFNGLNVYELPYGYTDQVVIEGPTLISPDVWISDPTIR
jgi:hypothetical protein